MLRSRGRRLLPLVAIGLVGACTPTELYPCTENTQCVDGERTGICEAVGYCSFPDASCESHRKFGPLAPAEYADQCVVPNGTCVAGIEAGASHTCAWKVDGTVWCWGDADAGQLGNGQSGAGAFAAVPMKVRTADERPLSGVVAVVAGAQHTCARTNTGKLVCWGNNEQGQLGDGTFESRPYAAAVLGANGDLEPVAAAVAGTDHSCALVTSQSSQDLYCFGQNRGQQAGSDTVAAIATPTLVPRPSSGAEPQAGYGGTVHTCALYGDRSVWCWGTNADGRLGAGPAAPATTATPVQVVAANQPVTNALALSAGDAHSCIATSIGEVRCWGDGRSGQIGDADSVMRTTATRVFQAGGRPLAGVTAVGLGAQHSCAVVAQSALIYCWGLDVDGQVGSAGPNKIIATPVQDKDGTELEGFKSVVGGQSHTCALRDDGSIWCWGSNARGRLGSGDASLDPSPRRVALSCP